MSGDLFEEWLYELDNKFHREGRKLVMIIDNYSAHPHIENPKAMNCFLAKKYNLHRSTNRSRCYSKFESKTPHHSCSSHHNSIR